MAITQTIATLPAVLNDSATFYEDIAERNNSLVTTVLPSINVWAIQANITQTEIDEKAAQVAAQAVDGGYSQDYINSNFVGVNNAQDITEVKTFIESPIVPTPTTAAQATNKDYVDNKPSGFKNLIINGNKTVNQSGLTTTDNSYNYDNHYKVGNNWFMFVNGKNIVSGKPYTLSWDGTATAGYYIGAAGALTINAQTFTPITNGTTITPTITSSQKLWIKFSSDASGSTYNKVQLESGTVPTLFEHRTYELEESFVQRVYEHGIVSTSVLSSSSTYQGGISNAYFKTTKDIVPQIVITTNNGSKNAHVWVVGKDIVQFGPTVQASADDFINVVANIDARPY